MGTINDALTVTTTPILFLSGGIKERLRLYNRSSTTTIWMREGDGTKTLAELQTWASTVVALKGTPIDPMS